MTHWVTPQEISELDRSAIASGTPSAVLMERAGTAVADLAQKMMRDPARPVIVLAGPGNNGGDGFVAARLLLQRGYAVSVHCAFADPQSCSDDCRLNRSAYLDAGGRECTSLPFAPGLVIEALLGTGFKGKLKGPVLEAIQSFIPLGCPVLSVDCPTGVNGLTGEADPSAVRADVTLTFAAPKLGLLLPPGCGHTGALFVHDIGIPVPENHLRQVMDVPGARALLPARPVDAHKGSFGRVLVLAGSELMPGAAIMAAMGAVRSGAGIVELCVPLPAATAVSGRLPEALCGYFLPGDVTSLPDPSGFSSAVIGPGMGADAGTAKIVRYTVEKWRIPLVLDADALNVMDRELASALPSRNDVVLTPHPGELSRLTGCSAELGKRFDAAAKLASVTGCSVLLKGKPTQLFMPDGGRVMNPTGNNGLATGGSGDVLSGLIAGLMAQGLVPARAASLGAFVHGLSCDVLSSLSSPRSLIPTDLPGGFGKAFSLIENGCCDHLIKLEGNWNGRLWDIP